MLLVSFSHLFCNACSASYLQSCISCLTPALLSAKAEHMYAQIKRHKQYFISWLCESNLHMPNPDRGCHVEMSRAQNEMRLNAPRYLMPPRLFKDAISEVNAKLRCAGGESHNSSWRCAAWRVVNYQRRKQTHCADTQALKRRLLALVTHKETA